MRETFDKISKQRRMIDRLSMMRLWSLEAASHKAICYLEVVWSTSVFANAFFLFLILLSLYLRR